MHENGTREKIVRTANRLFKKNGYEKTGVRDIAKASGISLSNLQYYYPKKVLIMSDVYNLVISKYIEEKSKKISNEEQPIMDIMALEYEFILRAHSGKNSWESYISSLLIPEVCGVYVEKSTKLMIDCKACPERPWIDLKMANTVMYGGIAEILQFHLQHPDEYRLHDLLAYPFTARLQLLSFENSREMTEKVFADLEDEINKK